ncbi:uncharacterized protein LOC116264189 [Nymphaea colorata]|nr:uncharacterized protein LOC116264189 [Nymphaea colorata]
MEATQQRTKPLRIEIPFYEQSVSAEPRIVPNIFRTIDEMPGRDDAPELASLDPFETDDAQSPPSDYSSCNESEFEKYCSANSVMGTPSVCSSFGDCNEFLDLESDSLRHSLDAEDKTKEKLLFSGYARDGKSGRLHGRVDTRNFRVSGNRDFTRGVSSVSNVLYGGQAGSFRMATQSQVTAKMDFMEELKVPLRTVERHDSSVSFSDKSPSPSDSYDGDFDEIKETSNCASPEKESNCISTHSGSNLSRSTLLKLKQDDGSHDTIVAGLLSGEGMEGLKMDSEHSSEYGSSDAEDSNLDPGTDDEKRVFVYAREDLQRHEENTNPLLMNSIVAFGSDDWNQFVLETGDSDPFSISGMDPLQMIESGFDVLSKECKQSDPSRPQFGVSRMNESRQFGASMEQLHVIPFINSTDHCIDDDPCSHQGTNATTSTTKNKTDATLQMDLQSCIDGRVSTELDSQWCKPLSKVNNREESVAVNSAILPANCHFDSVEASKKVLQYNLDEKLGSYNESSAKHFSGSTIFLDSLPDVRLSEPTINGRVSTGLDSQQCKPIPEVNNEEEPVAIRDGIPPENYHLDSVEVSKKVLWCNLDEKLGGYDESSAKHFSGSTISLGTLPDVRVSDPAMNRRQKGKELPGAHVFSDSTIITGQLKQKSQQCLHGDSLDPNEVGKLDVNESYDDMVQDMESVLLESVEPHGAIFSPVGQGGSSHPSQVQPCRDGSSTASTSGVIDVCSSKLYINKIDWIEVVGAKQKRGEVSFGERLVGVKEYTVYIIRVWSGKNHWEVEHRYRDFFTLYRQLKIFFKDHGLTLPSPWVNVERESRKIFGNASPDVINERSALIQECLRSILYTETHVGIPNSFVWFLSQENTNAASLLSTLTSVSARNLGNNQEASFYGDPYIGGVSSLGKTISLVVEIHPSKSMKQLLEAQHYKCAGCYKHLDVKKSLMLEFAQSLGWGKLRLCEYTGQLFCSACHSNDTAVLPARVLQHWDFSLCPVSQLAKAYLDSIYDQPMLCVSAVNPYLFSKVPPLLHVMGIRKKVAAMLQCVRCPFRRSIERSLGSRRYLIESNDFFALRDLVDLSKGAFAALPVMMDTLSSKTLEHITQQCLLCCDVGEPCGARLACDDPSSLIFPFQESDVAHCSSCGSVFHHHCFEKLPSCPCGIAAGGLKPTTDSLQDQKHGPGNELGNIPDLSLKNNNSRSAASVLSNLFSKVKFESPWKGRSDPVILMGSLSSLPP